MARRNIAFLALVLAGCAEPTPETFTPAPDRDADDRTPLTRSCDELDSLHCLLPWPSSAFSEVDESTETGIRLYADLETNLNEDDVGDLLRRADGFSRVSPMVTGFQTTLDPESVEGQMRLFERAADGTITEVPVRLEVPFIRREEFSMLAAHPYTPMSAATDHFVVVTDGLRTAEGEPIVAEEATRIILGLTPPTSPELAELVGYHAPLRAVLEDQGIDFEHVLTAWDFTTRSSDDPIHRYRTMREQAIEAVTSGEAELVIDSVENHAEGAVAAVVMGHFTGMPDWIGPNGYELDDEAKAKIVATRDAPFRIVVPRGEGNYRFMIYGHGLGGNERDGGFDEDIAANGAAKVGFRIYGWTDDSFTQTFPDLSYFARGASKHGGEIGMALAHASAIRAAMSGTLGDALAADTLGGEPNPNAGRRPDDSIPMWVGGSLGGTTGLIFAAAEPDMNYAVLNVPGAAWTTWVRDAAQYSLVESLGLARNGGPVGLTIAVSMAQTFFDEADGASWWDVLRDEHPVVALVQESETDMVLPNPGSRFVARVVDAVQIGAVLDPVYGLEVSEETDIVEASAFTQYWERGTRTLDIHGFAANDSPAGIAGREQIFEFVLSAWEGESHIVVPAGCIDGVCDFRE